MNAKTKAFLSELVDLCIEHGVTFDESENYAESEGGEAYTESDFSARSGYTKASIRIEISEIAKAIKEARRELATPKPMLVYRHGKNPKKREWLKVVRGKFFWMPRRSDVIPFALTTASYSRLISRLEKTDKRDVYMFGREDVKS